MLLLLSGGGGSAFPSRPEGLPEVIWPTDDGSETVTPEPSTTSTDPAETGDYTPIECSTTHRGEALGRLLYQYSSSYRLQSLLDSYVRQVQEWESAICELRTMRDLDQARDQYLDDIGAIVGEARDGLVDAEYLRFIRARIIANDSAGEAPDLLEIVRTVLPGAGFDLRISHENRATIVFEQSGDAMSAVFPTGKLYNILNAAKKPGIHLAITYAESADADVFSFGPVPPTIDASRGFGPVSMFSGGFWAGSKGPKGHK